MFYLVFAEIMDHGIPEAAARGDAAEVERLTSERDFMLRGYFGADIYEQVNKKENRGA